MDRRHALLELPTAYAVALRLHEAGVPARDIAVALEVAEEAVPRLIEIGAAKLDAVLAAADRRLADAG